MEVEVCHTEAGDLKKEDAAEKVNRIFTVGLPSYSFVSA
jgi:UDP-N-acetylglucosamine 2-epimerase